VGVEGSFIFDASHTAPFGVNYEKFHSEDEWVQPCHFKHVTPIQA
jgi:hypothetical protein